MHDVDFLKGTVHVVDDDASFRTALERRLRTAGYIVATYPSAEQLLNDLSDFSGLGCIILDVRLPGLSGPELQERLRDRGSTLPILFLTGYPDIPTTVNTIKAGAEDFLVKPINSDQLIRAIERAIARHGTLQEQKTDDDLFRARFLTLTPRQRQVFQLVVQGKQNKQIANQLGATERTIKAHRHDVMEKMEARSLAELLIAAERLGVLSAPAAPRSTLDEASTG
jgi:FixJ family two-component response regulator